MNIVVAGASGFVGRLLVERLAGEGHRVVALSRNPDPSMQREGVETRGVDVADYEALTEALQGAEAAYYLVHSMGGDEFVSKDLELAGNFARAASAAGTGRIVYQGGLGRGKLSKHLSSRQRVGEALGSEGVPVVELRAAVILGSGSISFEMMRYLTERLPVMVCPRWVLTSTEPIAMSDVMDYLVMALEVEPGVYEIGCGQPVTYESMMQLFARIRGLRRRLILHVPLLSLRLSGYWVDLITPLNRKVTRALIGSLTNNVTVVERDRTTAAFGIEPLPIEAAMRKALDDQAAEMPDRLLEMEEGLEDNVYRVRVDQELEPEIAGAVRRDLAEIGGDLAWYGWPWAWRARFVLGLLLGEKHPVAKPKSLVAGEAADWWTIERTDESCLILRSSGWSTGEGWLGYEVAENRLRVAAAFRPRGLPGFLYWFLLTPLHRAAFRAMAAARVRRASAGG